jgi:hypothetical protein
MSSTQSLLQKADLAIADLTANGGTLTAEQGASFIRKLIKEPTLIKQCRVVEMTSPQRKINKIGFGARILRKATSGVALTSAQRSKPTTDQIQLNTKEQIAEIRLPYDVLEDNIERAAVADNSAANTGPGGLRQTILDLIAERAALDLEELGLLGDTAYVNAGNSDDQDYLAQNDGWLKMAATQGHVADGGNTTITKAIFKAGLKTMPSQFLRNRTALRHFVSVNNLTEYRDTLADRIGALGDANVTGLSPTYAYGSPVEQVALMPETTGLFCDPMNLIFGIQRQVSMEFDKDITARVYIIVLTCRIDFKVEEPNALVYYQNMAA